MFIGPPGSGKTTALCKWLTAAVLRGEHRARVWRLDGETANTSEFLSLHCEMVGVPVERFWDGIERHGRAAVCGFARAWKATASGRPEGFARSVAALPAPHVHLVLNAAYETVLLFEQFNWFAQLVPEDLIFTHLDEERRRVKLWNFVLGTNCSLGLAGQPGKKFPATSTGPSPHFCFHTKNSR